MSVRERSTVPKYKAYSCNGSVRAVWSFMLPLAYAQRVERGFLPAPHLPISPHGSSDYCYLAMRPALRRGGVVGQKLISGARVKRCPGGSVYGDK